MSEYEQWRTGDDVDDDALWVGRQNDEQVHGMKIMLITDWDSVSALRVQESLSPYPLALSLSDALYKHSIKYVFAYMSQQCGRYRESVYFVGGCACVCVPPPNKCRSRSRSK